MRILFASPARDLLECYKAILEADFGETVTAFDGTQVISLLSSGKFDAAIVDCDIPRIGADALISRMREEGLPVIALSNGPVGQRELTGDAAANAYLSYPFNASDMERTINDTMDKAKSGESFEICGMTVDVPGFRIAKGPLLTSGEIDVLKDLLHGKRVTADDGAKISALNAKFASVGSKASIKYRMRKGFELVERDE